MLFQGFLACLLLATACTMTTYVINSTDGLINKTCSRFDRIFQPCSSLINMGGRCFYDSYDETFFLLDNNYIINESVILNFRDLFEVNIRPWKRDSLISIKCKNDFSIHIDGTNQVNIEFIQFYFCGKSVPVIVINEQYLLQLTTVKIQNTHFIGNYRLIVMYSSTRLLQVTNSSFTDSIISAIHIEYELENVTLQNVLFKSNTMALTICDGSTITLINCVFIDNKRSIHSSDIRSLRIYNSSFIGNSLESAIVAININNISIFSSHFFNNTSFESGGAIRALSVKDASLHITNSSITYNYGKVHGGAIFFNGYRSTFEKCTFIGNIAGKGGGSVYSEDGSIGISNCMFAMNKVVDGVGGAIALSSIKIFLAHSSKFFKNFASQGGAVQFKGVLLKIYQCHSDSNQAKFDGGALTIESRSVNISESNLTMNSVIQGNGGAMKLSGCECAYIIECIFKENTATTGAGMYLLFSHVQALNISVSENVAKLAGGGIALKMTKILFQENMTFIDNKVISNPDGKGGAIYMNDQSEDCSENSCAISWTNQSTLIFVHNTAFTGPLIYGGMLNRCTSTTGFKGTDLEKIRVNGYDYDLQSYAITSSPVNFCFCSNCNLRTLKESTFPGQSFEVNLICVDQLSQPVNNCIIRADFYMSTKFQLGQGETKQEINGCSSVKFHALSNIIDSAILEISSDIFCKDFNWSKLRITIDLKPCPLGFELYDKECRCDKRLHILIDLVCDINNKSLIYQHSGWFSYKGGLIRAQKSCPLNYCLKSKKYISPKDPDSQCAYNRGGILCGGCVANYSVVLGSWKCMDCSHLSRYNFIWLTALLALAGMVLVVFLLVVKMTVASGTTNGLIFYANILSFSGLMDYDTCPIHPLLRIFLSWINLDLGIEVCYYSGMDVYQKTWLQFIFPFYIWFLVGVIILFCHYSSRVMKLMGMRNIEVLATLFLLSYAKLLKTIVTTFSFTDIMVAQAENVSDPLLPTRVWIYDGSITYFQGEHLPLFIICLLFLIFLFFPYTLFLTLGHYLQYLPRRKGLKFFHGTLITTIIDAYHAPYQKSHRYWTGLGLLIRCILFTIFATSSGIKANIFWIGAASVFLLSVKLFTRNHIYRNKLVDSLETFSLINLLVLALVFTTETFCDVLTASISLAMIECATVIVFHIQQEMRKIDILQKYFIIIFQCFKKKNIQPSQEDKQPETVQKEPSVSYIQLRESLLEH